MEMKGGREESGVEVSGGGERERDVLILSSSLFTCHSGFLLLSSAE